jgi:acyl-[acyl-carrier-protein]-phospholipid O-acyltransferase/long-chain-fatty-acid--[acyl-carrier-protein] ligase
VISDPFASAGTIPFAQLDSVPAWAWIVGIVILLLIPVCLFPYWILLRVPLWIVSRTIYRVTAHGLENVPRTGPVLIVSNHLSHIDAGLIQCRIHRPVRFLIWAPFLQVWWLWPILRLSRVIPVKGTGGPRAILQSLRAASDALARGEVVVIFAEGGITRTGFLLPFQRGLEQIVKRCPAPIIPVCLDHVWGSIFSFRGGRFFWKLPRQIPYPVTVSFGPPLPPETPAHQVRHAIQYLLARSFVLRSQERLPVHRQFVRIAGRRPFRPCLVDPTNAQKPYLTYAETLAGAKILTRLLRPVLGDEKMVGLWLPPSTGGALANIVVAFLGKVAVNLNYTASPSTIQSSIRQCGIRKVLTARLFTNKLPLDPGPGVELVYLEEYRKKVSKWDQIRAFLSVLLVPSFVQDRWVLRLGRHRSSDLATIVFSSGSTGEPKGVMLTHDNIASNCESMIQAIDPSTHDRLLGILPFFHSFGYTVTLWVTMQVGASTAFYPNPLAAKEIGEACHKVQATIFLSTPTFLRSYLKRCQPNDFKSLRLLICGAEKLPQALAQEFKEKFGILPMEGYGCTELSPVAAANVPDWVADGYKQVGNKCGTIGQPVPGVAAKVVHRETLTELPVSEEGLLLFYGANVMKGYLGREDLTQQKIIDGWYVTGDVARIDEDGFITITGREERFAKVGGEMVPLELVEEELQHVLGTNERACVVTAIPDEKKGERLVVLHLPLNGKSVEQIRHELSTRGLPNISIPGNRDFYQVDHLPVLGSGKVDLKRCKEQALELAGKS